MHLISLIFNIIIYWASNSCLLFWCWISLWSNSNADWVSWWELTVLASHVHPSVAAMARTLLSGANIVYSGNPLNDLSLGSFLDKFMEKKPRQSTWHGSSQIEPVKKVRSPKLFVFFSLYGVQIFSLDIFFRTWCMIRIFWLIVRFQFFPSFRLDWIELDMITISFTHISSIGG